jgi:DeoR family glycerol-3-phosphate regulon repressor
MKQAQETWVIADRTKFGREAPVKVCELSAVDVVVADEDPPLDFASRCQAAGVRIVTPKGLHREGEETGETASG